MWAKSKNWLIKRSTGVRGKVTIGIISFTEAIFFPVPTDTFMMAILLVQDNAREWLRYATITMTMSVLGALTGYLLAFYAFDLFGPQVIAFYGLESEFADARDFIHDGLFLFMFFGAISPIPFKLFVLTAGLTKANLLVFIISSMIGRSARIYPTAWLVHKYGKPGVELVKRYMVHVTIIAVAVITIFVLGYMFM